jgi:hypothetical protein
MLSANRAIDDIEGRVIGGLWLKSRAGQFALGFKAGWHFWEMQAGLRAATAPAGR